MIGPRLQAVASLVLPGRPAADVACDHARLAIALVSSGHVPSVLASDIAEAPLAGARANVAASGLRERVRCVQAPGLGALSRGAVATVCVAGVGGRRAIEIVRGARELAIERVVVQANKDVPLVRETLCASGWHLVDERAAIEGRRAFIALAFRPALDGLPLSPAAALVGPHLARRGGPAARAWWSGQRARRVKSNAARFAQEIAWLDAALGREEEPCSR